MGPTDEDLASAFGRGDDGAFDALVERYAEGAVRFAAHFVREHHEAEDVAQDGFVKLVPLLRGGGFDPRRGRFAPFFFRMLRNLALDRLRARPRRGAFDGEVAAPGEHEAPRRLEEDERRAAVRRLVEALPENERAAIVLREFEGLSYREIADALGAPLDTIKTWIFRARRRIEEAWLAQESDRDRL